MLCEIFFVHLLLRMGRGWGLVGEESDEARLECSVTLSVQL